MYAVPYTFLSLSAVLGSLLSRLHWVTVWSQQKQEKHAGAQNCSTTFVVCLLLERLKNPAECPGWWQLDFGVTFEACPSTHSPRGTHVSYVQPHNSLCCACLVQETPSPHLWLEKKISKYSKWIQLCLVTLEHTEEQCLKRHQQVPSTKAWTGIELFVIVNVRALETVQVFVVKADFFFLTSPASLK